MRVDLAELHPSYYSVENEPTLVDFGKTLYIRSKVAVSSEVRSFSWGIGTIYLVALL